MAQYISIRPARHNENLRNAAQAIAREFEGVLNLSNKPINPNGELMMRIERSLEPFFSVPAGAERVAGLDEAIEVVKEFAAQNESALPQQTEKADAMVRGRLGECRQIITALEAARDKAKGTKK